MSTLPNISQEEIPPPILDLLVERTSKKELRKVHRYLLDKEMQEISPRWHALSEKNKTALYCRMCFALWLMGWATPASRSDILFGAWVCYTRPIHDAWFDLLDQLADPDAQITLCGIFTVLFYVVIVARSLGGP
jgi:hypothetical protein